jgi:dTMP kinase
MSLFVAIEGGDGSGKATQAEKIRAYAEETQGKQTLKVSFPRYGEPSAYYVEQYLNGAYGSSEEVPAELGILPYALDRFAARGEIENHLKLDGGFVIADRYMASNLAHQGAKIDDPVQRKAFYERTMQTEYDILGIPRPSKNIVLLMPTTLAQANVDKKDARSYTDKKRDIHEADASHLEKAKRNYEELCSYYPDEFIPLNCMKDKRTMKSIEEVHEEIKAIIGSRKD